MTAGFQGKLVDETTETKPAKETKLYILENNDATVYMLINDIHVKDWERYNDYYGYMTCIKNAIKGAKKIVKRYSLKLDSDEVEIIVKHRRCKTKNKKTGRKQYFNKDQDEYEQVGYEYDETTEIVWSSKDGAKDDAP